MASVISTSQARAQLTSMCVDVFTDMVAPTGFLRSFFPSVQEFTRYLSIQVERDYELLAVDVSRGTEGNRNKFTTNTEKVIDAPYYREYFEMTDIDLYDRLFGSVAIDAGIFSQIVAIVARRLSMLKAKIERAYELQCAQVMMTGVVSLASGDSIDFRRKSASLVDLGAGNYWATNTIDPFQTLENGAIFLRTVGKSPDSTFNVIMGQQAHADLMNNSLYKARVNQNLNNNIDSVNAPQRNSAGAAYHGVLSTGSWKMNLWTYPQYYDVVSGGVATATPYIDNKKVAILPANPRFKLGFAAVPRVLRADAAGTGIVAPSVEPSPYLVEDYIDPRLTSHIMDIKSCGIAIPTAVDQLYTVKVVA